MLSVWLACHEPRWFFGRRATASVEYALLLAVLVIVGVGVWVGLGATIRDVLQQVADSFNEVGP